jgi:hypothetical protein
MPAPTFVAVNYIDPWAMPPPGTFQTGVVAQVSSSGAPAGYVLAAQVLQGAMQLAVAVGSSATLARVLPPLPLVASQSYSVQVQWVAQGKQPNQLDWTQYANISTAPLVTSGVRLEAGSQTGSTLVLSWSGEGGSIPAGAFAQIFDSSGVLAGSVFSSGGSGSGAFTPSSGASYTLYIQAVQPITAAPQGGFSGPFTSGPLSAPLAVPASAPAISAVAYDGANLSVSWPAIASPSVPVADLEYLMCILAGGQVLQTFSVGPTGGQTSVILPGSGTALQVAGMLRYGPLTGPLGTPQSILSTQALIQSVSVAQGNQVTVTVVLQPLSVSGTAYVQLVINGVAGAPVAAGGSPPEASLTGPITPGSSTYVQAYLTTSGSGFTSTGPMSAAAPVIAAQPAAPTGTYDGLNLTVTWPPVNDPAVTGYVVTLTPSSGSALTFTTGPEAILQTTVNLNLGATWQVSVQPIGAASTGSTSSQASVSLPAIAAPSITGLSYDGSNLTINWTRGSLPYLTGYTVALSNGPSYQTGPETSLTVPLAASSANGVTAMVTANSATRSTPASSPGAVVAIAPVITSVTVPSSVITVAWTVSNPPTGATYVGELLEGDVVIATAAATSSGATFTAPTTSGAYSVRGRINASPAAGPAGASIPALTLTPAITSANYDGQTLSLAWQGGSPGLMGYNITLTPVSGSTINIVTGAETTLNLAIFLDLGTAWTVAAQAFGVNTLSPASSAQALTIPAVAAPSISGLSYDGSNLTINWTRGSLPYLTGYSVALSNGSNYQTGPETSLTVALAASSANGVTAAVTANSATRSTAASSPGAVVAIAPVITGVTVASSVITVAWSVSNPPTGASYVGELLDGETVIATASGTATGVTFAAPSGNGSYSVRGRLNAPPATGPAGASIPALTQAPTIQFGALTNGNLELSWAPPPIGGVSGYVVTIGGTQFATAATSLKTPVDMQNLAGTSLTVAAIAPGSTGPSASQQIVAAYTIASGTYDGATLNLTLGGTPSPAPAQVTLQVLLNGSIAASTVVTGAPPTNIQIAVALPPGSASSVAATGAGAGSITPPGATAAIPTSQPDALTAAYDGTQLHVSWDPVSDPGVTGYQVSVAGAQSPVTPVYVAGVSNATVSAAFSLPFSQSPQVTVQAAVTLGANNLLLGPGNTVPPQLAGYLRAIAAPGSAEPPYLYRSGLYQTLAAISAANVIAYLPNPFTQGTPTVPSGTGNIFQLAPAPQGSALPYQLTIDKSVWTFGADTVRSALRQSYRQFLVTVEQAGVTPWAIRLVRQIICEAMPQTYAETLYYRYGIWRDNSARLLDLEPGLGLQISGALYQLINANVQNPLNGFIPAGGEIYDIAEAIPSGGGGTLAPGPARMLTVDAFLSTLFPGASGVTTDIAAGSLDFFRSSNRQDFYRLFYPPTILSSGSTGSSDLAQNIALIGAPTWQILEYVTDQYSSTGFFPPSGNYYSAYFRGHATISPVLKLTIAGEPCTVPPGATLRQALCAIGLAVWQGPSGAANVELQRAVSSLYDEPFGAVTLRYEPVNLSEAAIAGLDPPLWSLDLPLFGGDVITIETGK